MIIHCGITCQTVCPTLPLRCTSEHTRAPCQLLREQRGACTVHHVAADVPLIGGMHARVMRAGGPQLKSSAACDFGRPLRVKKECGILVGD